MYAGRYARTQPEFWLAYWYHEMGGEGLSIPEVASYEWWHGRCIEHVTFLQQCLWGFVTHGDIDDMVRRGLEYSLELWGNIPIRCPAGVGDDGLILEQHDLVKWYAPEIKQMARIAFAVRHVANGGVREWSRSERKNFNRAAVVVGMEFRLWSFDHNKRRENWGMEIGRHVIPESSQIWRIINE